MLRKKKNTSTYKHSVFGDFSYKKLYGELYPSSTSKSSYTRWIKAHTKPILTHAAVSNNYTRKPVYSRHIPRASTSSVHSKFYPRRIHPAFSPSLLVYIWCISEDSCRSQPKAYSGITHVYNALIFYVMAPVYSRKSAIMYRLYRKAFRQGYQGNVKLQLYPPPQKNGRFFSHF